jgi:hypothetical protein
MWITNPIALYGWIIVIIRLFSSMPARKAVIISIMGSFLFLPMSTIKILPLIPELNKDTSIGYGILLGELFSGARKQNPLKMGAYDVPMIIFCFLSPIASSLSNGLGLYDGISGSLHRFLSLGIVFWAGRRYFGSLSSLRALTTAMMIGGLICIPMVLFEVRMSPKLHESVYGFFQHDWSEMIRKGGFRPILFMQHGLMVALWMSVTTVITFWLWQTKEVAKIWKVSAVLAFCALAVSSILCKSSGAFVFMLLGILSFYVYRHASSYRPLRWLILVIPIYIGLRLTHIITVQQIISYIDQFFGADRVNSLRIRLTEEDLFGVNALLRPLFGWGWMGRAWPVNPNTGALLIQAVDPYWVIVFGTSGFLGLGSIYLALGMGPLRVLSASGKSKSLGPNNRPPFATDAVVLSLVLALFLLDSLMNAMVAPIYILCAGALISYCERDKEENVMEKSHET